MIDFVAECALEAEDTIQVYDQASHIERPHQHGVVFTIKSGGNSSTVILKKDDVKSLIEQLSKFSE